MSHFMTYVFHKRNGKDCEELLAPYEEGSTAPYIKYTKAQAIAEQRKQIESYKNTTYAEYLKDPEKYEKECSNESHIDYLKNEFPKRLKWTDRQCYREMVKYYDKDMIDEEGNIWETYNPNSKWDWYVAGGRWSEILVTKEGGKTDEDYVSEVDFEKTPVPFAYVDPVGRWFEKGEMGWWAIVSNEKDGGEWEAQFKKFVSKLGDDVIVTVVDCHI